LADGDGIPVGRQAVALVVAALALAGCGFGGGDDKEKDQFLQRADSVCQSYGQRIGNIPPPQSFLRDFAVYMRRAVPLARQQNRELRKLVPPDDVADDYRQMLGLLDQQLAFAQVAGEEAYAGRDDRAQVAYRESLGPASEASRIARRIGFSSCAGAA
jgi:hypothetical protein